jgi:hypothetical protein
MNVVELIRLEESFKWGTFGVLRINKAVFCVTLEPCDKLNAPNVSSIPAQQYICERHSSPKFGACFIVKDVPERDLILLHSGNLVGATEGCLLLAEHYGKLGENRAILNSGLTFNKFMLTMDGVNEFHLTIKEVY